MHDTLDQIHGATVPAHAAGAVPMDSENKQRVDTARQEAKAQRTERVGDKLSRFLNRIADEIETLDREKRLNLFRKQIKAHQYMDGNFYGYVDQNCQWRQKQQGPDEVWYSDNQLYPYLRTALMEMSRTQTEIVINAPAGASDELIAAAKFAKARYDANRARTFNARLKQTENVYALLNGITFRYTYAQFGSGRKERIPKLQQQEAGEGEIKRLCAMCSRPVPEPENITGKIPDPKCLACGSEIFLEIGMSERPDTIIGYEDVPTCQNAWIVPNPVGIIVSLQASCIEETPFLKWKQMILRSVLQDKFKGLELPSTGTESVELRYITNQQKATPAGDGEGGLYEGTETEQTGRELELLEFQQTWLDYPVYCSVKFDEDTPLGRGKVLKAGQPLGSMFPNGLYFARCGDLILDIWNEDKNRKWVSSPYGMRPGSMYGSGSHTALSDQEIINDLATLKMANAWANGVPREFVDPDIIPELSADPTIPTSVRMAGVDRDIMGRAYAVAPGTALSAEIYGIGDKAESSIQNKIGAMSGTGSGGLADSQKWGDTATAISIKRELAVGRFSPDLELMADQLDRPQARQFLENEQEFYTPGQWEREKGEYGDEALKAFLNCDVSRDLIISVAPGSYMPKSDAQVQAKLVAYSELIPLLAQMQNPELIAYAAETFGIPESLGGWNSDKSYANKLVRRFQALADLFIDQYGDLPSADLETFPQALAIARQIDNYAKMPVDVFLDNHEAIIDALKDWRATDEGRDASNVLLAAVDFRVLKHQEGIAKQGQMLNRIQIAAAEPMQEVAAEEQAATTEAQNAANEQARDDAETQMIADAGKELMNHAERDDQRTHESEMLEKKQSHEKEIEAARLLTAGGQEQDSENPE